jgi:hypothetical protein
MAMNNVSHLEASKTYVPDALQFVREFITIKTLLSSNMGEHPISFALSNVESLAVSRVDEPIDVRLESTHYLGWK